MDTALSLATNACPIPNGSLHANSDQVEEISICPEDRSILSTACTACRDKHLKCGGGRPCARCQSSGGYCLYIRSKRGYKGLHQRNSVKAQNSNGTLPADNSNASVPLQTIGLAEFSLKIPEECNSSYSSTLDNHLHPTHRQRCLEGYFLFFHHAHPFLVPREHMKELSRTKPIPHLETAMCYVTSQYVSTHLTTTFALELESLLASVDVPNDGYLVQALLLFVIGLDGHNERLKALEVLNRAQRVALQLGMHQHGFAILNGRGLPVLEESWRRTWWELYVINGFISGLHQISKFHLFEIVADVPLPCEEDAFRSGHISTLYTIDDFDELLFSSEEPVWSSYTYRILASRNLGRILEYRDAVFFDNSLLASLDNHLVNWRLHLPKSKKECFDSNGQFDELLFQAHMITDVSSILLHRKYSQLHEFASQSITSCAPHPQKAPGWQSQRLHSAKTIQSAINIAKLITLPVSLDKHTHFFTCAIALASIIHLARWSASTLVIEDDDLKEHVRLSIGGLKAMAEVWPSAMTVLEQVTRVAQDVFSTRTSSLNSLLWNNFNDGDMADTFVGEETISNGSQPF